MPNSFTRVKCYTVICRRMEYSVLSRFFMQMADQSVSCIDVFLYNVPVIKEVMASHFWYFFLYMHSIVKRLDVIGGVAGRVKWVAVNV